MSVSLNAHSKKQESKAPKKWSGKLKSWEYSVIWVLTLTFCFMTNAHTQKNQQWTKLVGLRDISKCTKTGGEVLTLFFFLLSLSCSVYVCVRMCVCQNPLCFGSPSGWHTANSKTEPQCVCERELDRHTGKERKCVCVTVCVCGG